MKRYDPWLNDDIRELPRAGMEEDPHGDYVKHEDVQTLLNDLKAMCIATRFYFQRKATGTGDCVGWRRIQEMLGCEETDEEQRQWLESHLARKLNADSSIGD